MFVVFVGCKICNVCFGANAYCSAYQSATINNTPWGDSVKAIYMDSNATTTHGHYYICCSEDGSDRCGTYNTADHKRCFIHADSKYTNRCCDGKFAERASCDSSVSIPYQLHPVSRNCRDFLFGPYITNSLLPDAGYTKYNATFKITDVIGTANYTDAPLYATSWDTSGCSFSNKTASYDKCATGTVKWSANSTSGGNAIQGFYVIFNPNNAKYECTTCNTGYKKNNNGVYDASHVGCVCREHWDCSVPQCYYGYARNSSDDCVRRNNFLCGSELNVYGIDTTNDNYCKCKSGFDNNGCTQCKHNFELDSNGDCICDERYYRKVNFDDDDPENDECELITGQDRTYTDETGTFYLNADDACSPTWWQETSGTN